MDINQLIEIIEKKILSHDCISKVKIEDKSFLHKNHKNNVQGITMKRLQIKNLVILSACLITKQ